MKKPYIEFYPRDWQANLELKTCGALARGVWIECMCVMAQVERYGYLEMNGRPLDQDMDALAKILGYTTVEVKHGIEELGRNHVFARTPEGVIFSRRMVRDHKKHEDFKIYGRKGGNPNLNTPPQTPPLKDTDTNTTPNPNPNPNPIAKDKGGVNPTLNPTLNPPQEPTHKKPENIIPPDHDSVIALAQELGNKEEGENFWLHFEANGWRVGGRSPMKNWHAALKKWMRNNSPGGVFAPSLFRKPPGRAEPDYSEGF